jgi:hypothetical protein
MQTAQWIIAAVTAFFVAAVAFMQWRTTQQKAVLDLFERRHAIYEIVRKAVGTMASNSAGFDQKREVEYMQAMEDAYFFFGDDVANYVRRLWSDIMDVWAADKELEGTPDTDTRRALLEKRRVALIRIAQFHSDGIPLFARYMRFSQTVPMPIRFLDRLSSGG